MHADMNEATAAAADGSSAADRKRKWNDISGSAKAMRAWLLPLPGGHPPSTATAMSGAATVSLNLAPPSPPESRATENLPLKNAPGQRMSRATREQPQHRSPAAQKRKALPRRKTRRFPCAPRSPLRTANRGKTGRLLLPRAENGEPGTGLTPGALNRAVVPGR